MKKELSDLYKDELKDLYSAESQLVAALPRMVKAATSPDLKMAFESHLEETKVQIQRLEQVFEEIEGSPRGKKCKAMEGLVEEGAELIKEKADFEPVALDAALIGAAQRIEHYEIAAYGTVRTFAQQLGYTNAVRLLQQTLDEESAADKKLTALALSGINQQAV